MTFPDRRRVDRRKSDTSSLTTPDRRRGDRRFILGTASPLMPATPDRRVAERRAGTGLQLEVDTAVLSRLRAELAFSALSPAFARMFEASLAAHPGLDYRLVLADWLCRSVLPLALECAGWDKHAQALRAALAVNADTDIGWEHRLMQLRESVERIPDYRALVVVPDVDNCPLVACTAAVERSLRGALRSPGLASRLTHDDLASRAIVEHRRLRELAAGLMSMLPEPGIVERFALVEQRHRAFADSESQLLESLRTALASVDTE